MENKFNIKELDINKIRNNSSIVIIGNRNTGKSFLVKNLLKHKSDITRGIIISPNESRDQYYNNITTESEFKTYDQYNSKIVDDLINDQMIISTKISKQLETFGETNINLNSYAFLVLDDMMWDSRLIKDGTIQSIFFNGRNYKLLFIMTMQYAMGIPPKLRSNIDYLFLFHEDYMDNKQKIYTYYGGMFPSFEIFCQVMDQFTTNYNCLVIDRLCTRKSNKIENSIFWYNANIKI